MYRMFISHKDPYKHILISLTHSIDDPSTPIYHKSYVEMSMYATDQLPWS